MLWFNQLSIKSKLIAMLLVVSSCSILVTAYLGYQSGQSNLTHRAFSQLTSLRASKAYQIESYFKTVRNHIQTLTRDPAVITAIQEFTGAYRQLETATVSPEMDQKLAAYYREEFLTRLAKAEQGTPVLESFLPKPIAVRYLQYQYIAANPNAVGKKDALQAAKDGSDYSKIHARYHTLFRTIISKFGYYDLFLITPQGTIVYTVYKETDFATSLTNGAYSESNLARLVTSVRRSKEQEYTQIIDFEAYDPSYRAPAAFIGAPIFNQSEFLGVLAVQLPVDEINNVMTGNRNWERDGLGKTGETYLVGRDYLMRSISRFLVSDSEGYITTLKSLGVNEATIKRIQQYQTSILEQKVVTEPVKEALGGKQGTKIANDYRSIPVLSSYAPLNIEGLEWVILSEIDLAEAYAPIYDFGKQVLISATLLMLLVTLLAMALAGFFVKPINQLIKNIRRVEAGEFDAIVPLKTQDEFGDLHQSFEMVVRSLHHQTQLVEQKDREIEQLLFSLFPRVIAKRLRRGEKNIAESVANVSVIFSDLTGFSRLTTHLKAHQVIEILSDLVTAFDEAAERYGVEKVKTIGDSYMAVCGLSVPYLDHDRRTLDFALEMLTIVRRFNHEQGLQLNISIGIHSGDIIAGLVGKSRFIYDIWGDTVNFAHFLKSTAAPGMVLVSTDVQHRLDDLYGFDALEVIEPSSKESVKVWQLKSIQQPL